MSALPLDFSEKNLYRRISKTETMNSFVGCAGRGTPLPTLLSRLLLVVTAFARTVGKNLSVNQSTRATLRMAAV